MNIESSSTILFDNGSLRPESIIEFRFLCEKLSKFLKRPLLCAGLLHSHKVPAEKINGEAMPKLEFLLKELLKKGQKNFYLLPFFIGPSLAIKDYLPKILLPLKKDYPQATFNISPPLAGDNLRSPDLRLSYAIFCDVKKIIDESNHKSFGILLVDHGSPVKEVCDVKNSVGKQLQNRLEKEFFDRIIKTECYSMERRDGEAYAFNEPLLDKCHTGNACSQSVVILAPLFLLPGRHAGKGGDIDQILSESLPFNTEKIQKTKLLHASDTTIEILKDRLNGCLRSPWMQV
jgi:hypothetical protein